MLAFRLPAALLADDLKSPAAESRDCPCDTRTIAMTPTKVAAAKPSYKPCYVSATDPVEGKGVLRTVYADDKLTQLTQVCDWRKHTLTIKENPIQCSRVKPPSAARMPVTICTAALHSGLLQGLL